MIWSVVLLCITIHERIYLLRTDTLTGALWRRVFKYFLYFLYQIDNIRVNSWVKSAVNCTVSDIKGLFMTRTNVLKWYIYCFSGAKALIWQTYRPFCTNYWLLWCICLESYKLFTFSRKMLFHLYSHKEIELKNSVWAVLITSRAHRRCKNATLKNMIGCFDMSTARRKISKHIELHNSKH